MRRFFAGRWPSRLQRSLFESFARSPPALHVGHGNDGSAPGASRGRARSSGSVLRFDDHAIASPTTYTPPRSSVPADAQAETTRRSPSTNTDASAHGTHALFALAFAVDLIDLPVGSRGGAFSLRVKSRRGAVTLLRGVSISSTSSSPARRHSIRHSRGPPQTDVPSRRGGPAQHRRSGPFLNRRQHCLALFAAANTPSRIRIARLRRLSCCGTHAAPPENSTGA